MIVAGLPQRHIGLSSFHLPRELHRIAIIDPFLDLPDIMNEIIKQQPRTPGREPSEREDVVIVSRPRQELLAGNVINGLDFGVALRSVADVLHSDVLQS